MCNSRQTAPNLNVSQMHSQCNRNVEIAPNSFGNLKFVIKFAHNKNLKYKFRICQVYKSEAPVDNKALCVMQIPNMPRKFAVPTYLCQSPNLEMNWQCSQIESHISTLWMHLCDLQIRALSAMTEGASNPFTVLRSRDKVKACKQVLRKPNLFLFSAM